METLIRVNNYAGIANLASLQMQIASHRRTSLKAEQGTAVFNKIETLINSLIPLHRVPSPIAINEEIRNLQQRLQEMQNNNRMIQDRLIEAEANITSSDQVIEYYRRQLNDSRDINRGMATMR